MVMLIAHAKEAIGVFQSNTCFHSKLKDILRGKYHNPKIFHENQLYGVKITMQKIVSNISKIASSRYDQFDRLGVP